MRVDMSPGVIDAINELQENPVIVQAIAEAEDVILKFTDDDEHSVEILSAIRDLRYLKKFLDMIVKKEGGER